MDVLTKISRAMKEKNTEINDLEKKVSEITETMSNNFAYSENQNSKIKNLMEYHGKIAAQIVKLQANKANLDNKIERLTQKSDKLAIQLATVTEEHQNLFFYYETLQNDLERQKDEHSKAKIEVEKKNDERISDLIIRKNAAKDRVKEIKEKTMGIETIINEAKANTESEIKKIKLKSATDKKIIQQKIDDLSNENRILNNMLTTKAKQRDIDIRKTMDELSDKRKSISNETDLIREEYETQIKVLEMKRDEKLNRKGIIEAKYRRKNPTLEITYDRDFIMKENARNEKLMESFRCKALKYKTNIKQAQMLLKALEVDYKSIKENIDSVIKQKIEKEKQWKEGSQKVEDFEKEKNLERTKFEEKTRKNKQKLIEARYINENADLQIKELEFQRNKLIIDIKESKRQNKKVAQRFALLNHYVDTFTAKIKEKRIENMKKAFVVPTHKEPESKVTSNYKTEHSDFDSLIMESTESTNQLNEIEDLESLTSISTLPEMRLMVKDAKSELDKYIMQLNEEKIKLEELRQEHEKMIEENKELQEKTEHLKVMNEEIIAMRRSRR